MKKFHAWVQAHHHLLVLAALVAAVGAAALSAVIVARGPSTRTTAIRVALVPVATPRATAIGAKVVSGHVCDPKDYNLGCALPAAPVGQIVRGVDPVTQGVDFGWSCPVSVAKNFGASYLSYDTSKDWSLSCIRTFHSQHKGTVAVWEAGANDAQGSYSLGFSQAQRASQELSALGAPKGQPFDMAIDCDCAGSTLVSYFRGANAAEPGRVNAYGGYYQLLYLSQQHLVGHLNWQTYAWSGGHWLPASVAPLEQYLNSSQVDYDRAIAANYGQWPAPVVKPPVPLCSRSMCYKRFADATFKARTGNVCSHGCREATLVGDWQHSRSVCISVSTCAPQHSYRLWLRYRIQFLAHRLGQVIKRSSLKSNRTNFRYGRHGVLERIGYKARYATSWNGYLKLAG